LGGHLPDALVRGARQRRLAFGDQRLPGLRVAEFRRADLADLRRCPNCGAGELKIIAAILQRAAIEKILTHLGLDPRPPPRGRASEAGRAGHAFAAD
jgi:hypothetical protein